MIPNGKRPQEVLVQVHCDGPKRVLRTEHWQYVITADTPSSYREEALHDLVLDPCEWTNLIADARDKSVRDQLAERLTYQMVTAGEAPPLIHRGTSASNGPFAHA